MKFYVNTRPEIPDRHDEVVSLKERWYTLFQAGLLPVDYARGCTTMADVRVKIEASESYAEALIAEYDAQHRDGSPVALRDQLTDAGFGSGGVM